MAKKRYAVRVGRTPGIYDSWDSAQKEIHGYPGAQYKSFGTHAEAVAFMSGSTPPSSFVEVHDSGCVTRIDLTDRVRAALKTAGVALPTR